MQNDVSRFVVNIVPLANIQSNASGLDATAVLSNQVANILTMVDTEQHRINTDQLASFTSGRAIDVLSPLNLSNVGIQVNGTATGIGTTTTSVSTIHAGSTILTLADTISTGVPSFSIDVQTGPVFQILGNSVTSLSTVLEVGGSGTFAGTVSATGFVTLSDVLRKKNIQPIGTGVSRQFETIRPYYYTVPQMGSGDPQEEDQIEIGLLAQELEKVFPQCIRRSQNGIRYVNYNSVVALLLGAVRELNGRVDELERGRQ